MKTRTLGRMGMAVVLSLLTLLQMAGTNASAAGASLSRNVVAPGDRIRVTATALRPGDAATASSQMIIGGRSRLIVSTGIVSTTGTAAIPFSVPDGSDPGMYAITVRDLHNDAASVNMTVLPLVRVRAGTTSGYQNVIADRNFFIEGSNFRPNDRINVTALFPLYNGNTVVVARSANADASGKFFDLLENVPAQAQQTNTTVAARDSSTGSIGVARLTVTYRPTLSVASPVVRPGQIVIIAGSGFVPVSQVRVSLTVNRNDLGNRTLVQTVASDGNGFLNSDLRLPGGTIPGAYTVVARDQTGGFQSQARIQVASAPTIVLVPNSASPGDTITAAGGGFRAGVRVIISGSFPLFGGRERVVSTSTTSNAAGDFSVSMAVPTNAAHADVRIIAQGPQSQASAILVVRDLHSSISIAPASALPGAYVTVRGSGFLPRDTVRISVNVPLTTGGLQPVTSTTTTRANGTLSASLKVPADASSGTFVLTARSTLTSRAPTAQLVIAALAPSIVAVPTAAQPGTSVTVDGFGFGADVSVSIDLDGRHLGSTKSNSAGQFSTQLFIPKDVATGVYSLTASSSGGRNATVTLSVSRQISTRFYFPSEYTGTSYQELLAFLNPTNIRAQVTIEYQLRSGATDRKTLAIPPHSRFTESVNADIGPRVSASAELSADVPIVAERIVYHGQDGDVGPGATRTSGIWYFADGNTSGKYREYVAVENPNLGPVQLVLHFLPTHHRSFTILRNMAPTSRTTVNVNSYVPHDAVGVIVTSNGPVVANRTIFIRQGMTSQNGVTAPSRTWYFASGPANPRARNWIAAINPTSHWSFITLQAYGTGGALLGIHRSWLPPHQRAGYLMNRIAGNPDVAVWLHATSPIVAEQTTYRGTLHYAATDVFGTLTPEKSWDFAAVSTLDSLGARDLLNLFNPNLAPCPIVVQFVTARGTTTERTYVVGPLQHLAVDVGNVQPNAELGLVAASNLPFVALNWYTYGYGAGAGTSPGIHSG